MIELIGYWGMVSVMSYFMLYLPVLGTAHLLDVIIDYVTEGDYKKVVTQSKYFNKVIIGRKYTSTYSGNKWEYHEGGLISICTLSGITLVISLAIAINIYGGHTVTDLSAPVYLVHNVAHFTSSVVGWGVLVVGIIVAVMEGSKKLYKIIKRISSKLNKLEG